MEKSYNVQTQDSFGVWCTEKVPRSRQNARAMARHIRLEHVIGGRVIYHSGNGGGYGACINVRVVPAN